MIRNNLHECCYKCNTPDIEVVTDDYRNLAGDVTITNQLIRCTHEPICYIVQKEQTKENNDGESK